MFRNIHVAVKLKPLDLEYNLWKYLTLNNIVKSIKHFEPERVVIALDAKVSWRKKIYDNYKAHRSSARDASPVDFDSFFPVAMKFWEDLAKVFGNIYFLKIEDCEADDIIAVGTKYCFNDYDITNITSDSDMHQLYEYKNYSQYNPITKSIVKILNYKKELDIKIIKGDKSDNIPAIIKKCGKVTAEKIYNEGLDSYLLDINVKNNYIRNKMLIDFAMIPVDIKNKIISSINNYSLQKFDGRKLYDFVMKERIGQIFPELQNLSTYLNKVK
jgi:5'-3' exonuclease